MKLNEDFMPNKYIYLLMSLLAFFFGSALFASREINVYIFDFLVLIVICLCIYSVMHQLMVIFLTTPLGCISIITHWLINADTHSNNVIIFIHCASNIIFLTVITFFILKGVARERKITINTLLGAICSYFLIGLTWASIYQIIGSLNPDAFVLGTSNMTFHSILNEPMRVQSQYFIYYSYVTLTTVGYGDILAISPVAKTLSWMEAMTGQIFLVVWISQLVGLYVIERQKEENSIKK